MSVLACPIVAVFVPIPVAIYVLSPGVQFLLQTRHGNSIVEKQTLSTIRGPFKEIF